MNRLAGEHGYGMLLTVGLLLVVAYFVCGDAALLWTGGALTVIGALGDRLKSLKASAGGLEIEQYKSRALAQTARKAARREAGLEGQLGLSGELQTTKIAGGRGMEPSDIAAASTAARREVLELVANALYAATPEAFADNLAKLSSPMPQDLTVKASEHP